jgi:large subunit ribosomal protein L29
VVHLKIRDIRTLPTDSLKKRLDELNLDIGIERRKIASTGVSSKRGNIRQMKRTVARILTVIKERGAKS